MGFRLPARVARVLLVACLPFALAAAFVERVHAADDAQLLFIRAQALALEGRCEDALPLLVQARQADPRGTQASLLAGQCLIQLERYAEASQLLAEVEQRGGPVAVATLRIAVAHYHEGHFARAERLLEEHREELAGRPEFHLYRGLLRLRRHEAEGAARDLEEARRTGPERVEPAASYYAGLAWASAGELRRAEQAFERVRRQAPDTAWASRARRARADALALGRADAWVELTSGLEFDDNVVLRAGPVALPDHLPSQRDARAVFGLEAGREFFQDGPWSAGAMLGYRGHYHRRLDDFDLIYPTGTLWLDRRLGDTTTARLRYDLGYASYGGDPFLFSQALTPTLFQAWDDGSLTRLYVRYFKLDHLSRNDDVPGAPAGTTPGELCDPAGPVDPDPSVPACGPAGLDEESARNQSGNGLTLGAEHRLPLGFASTELRGGYAFHHFGARGLEYSFNAHELSLGTLSTLPLDLGLDTLVSYTWRPYRNASTFADPRDLRPGRRYPLDDTSRRDGVFSLDVELERPLSQRLTASLRYRYTRNHSNVAVFDYDRQILGAYLTVRLHR